MTIAATPKNLIGLSVLFLALASVFGVLNTHKTKTLRSSVADASVAREAADRRREEAEKQAKARETTADAKTAETEKRVAKAEADLVQMQTEKNDLQTKLQANEAEMAALQKRIEEAGGRTTTTQGGENPGAATPGELQAQLEDARRQLESAERENALLSDKLRSTEQRSTQVEEQRKRQRQVSSAHAGIRGVVLAVNQAYNFVVLNLGGRQGVEPNAEMLVVRDGTLIGKIRVSSVEPSTAIGDIITSSLERGVQVQPGDTVIYAGTNS